MSKDRLVLVYTGGSVIIERIKSELDQKGIVSITKDGFRQGLEAGFGGGIPSAIDLYVKESDTEEAIKIIKAIIE